MTDPWLDGYMTSRAKGLLFICIPDNLLSVQLAYSLHDIIQD